MSQPAALRNVVLLTTSILGFGLLFLLGYVLIAPIFGEGSSPVDAYWLGKLPWIGVAESLIVVGASACIAAGSVSVAASGGWLRRVMLLPALAPVALWWLMAMTPVVGAYCADCPLGPGDPFAYAYSAPGFTGLMLILPAAFILVLALSVPLRVRPEPLAHRDPA